MEPKEEPDWEAQPAQRKNRKSWADMVAEEKKETAKKDDKHEEKDEWWKREWKKVAKAGVTGGKMKRHGMNGT